MSRLKLRHLRIRVQAEAGLFGADLAFTDGLNVIEARNSRGKSICMQSVLFALGMEAMLGPRHEAPLPEAMFAKVNTGHGESPVVESQVLLEIEGEDGRVATISRWPKHAEIKQKLVTVWDGPLLTKGGNYPRHDHLVRERGVVDREVGFHHFLTEFVGWSLPMIQMASGVERPLYPEYLFSLLFVEQRGGWSGIQAQQPSFFVPDAKERAAEFIIGIDTYVRERARRQLQGELDRLARSWSDSTAELERSAEQLGFIVVGVPSAVPKQAWVASESVDLISIQTQRALTAEIGSLAEQLEAAEVTIGLAPAKRDLSREQNVALDLEQRVVVLAAAAQAVDKEISDEAVTQASIGRTLDALRVDLARNKDAQRVQALGAPEWSEPEQDCPTCHQPVTDVLLAVGSKPAMSLADNIAYLESEIDTLERLRTQSSRVQERRRLRVVEVRRELNDVRAQASAARAALLAPAGTPSVAAVQEAIILRGRISALHALEGRLGASLTHLGALAGEAETAASKLAAMPAAAASKDEIARVSRLSALVAEQLADYDFDSFDASEVEVTMPTLRPSRDGTPIGYGISASDGVRLVWSHLLGLMELGREFATRHPGLVMFDEPRQQSAAPESLGAFLERAANSAGFGQQVVIATSEERAHLLAQLDGLDHSLFHIDGRLLTAIDS